MVQLQPALPCNIEDFGMSWMKGEGYYPLLSSHCHTWCGVNENSNEYMPSTAAVSINPSI